MSTQIDYKTNQYNINNETVFYAINIPANKEKASNRFYFVFDELPTKYELINAIRNFINNKLTKSDIKSEEFREKILLVKENLAKVTVNNLDQFLDSYKTYRLDINSELYMTINRITPQKVNLNYEDRN